MGFEEENKTFEIKWSIGLLATPLSKRKQQMSARLKWAGEGATNHILKIHIKYSGFNGSYFSFYFNLLIEISSKYFLNTSFDFPKASQFFYFILKWTKKS